MVVLMKFRKVLSQNDSNRANDSAESIILLMINEANHSRSISLQNGKNKAKF